MQCVKASTPQEAVKDFGRPTVISGSQIAKVGRTATRMLGYLYRVTNPRIEDLVDEMLAILSDREAIIQKKELEHAQAVINDMYKNGL